MQLVETPASVKGLESGLIETIFPDHLQLVPQLNELYELQLAFFESRILSEDEIVNRGAYFSHVDGRPTRHFLICQGEPLRLADHSSSRLKAFFKTNQFKTGYGTHGLFPYRGKFHPQMVKGLLNMMGLKPAETVLDPMMGSGTTLIEASLMGIDSIGIDASPFCRFMTQAKLDGLSVPLKPIEWALQNADMVFDHFNRVAGHPSVDRRRHGQTYLELEGRDKRARKASLMKAIESRRVRDYLLLAFLDSAGYSIRSKRKTPFDQFRAILERYLFVARKIQNVLRGVESELGKSKVLEGDAREMQVEADQVEGILFSPPYSFAIDYVANDAFHLRSLGVDIRTLRDGMIGLRGLTLKEKFNLYMDDMGKVLTECHRVLRRGRLCTIVVGTNNQQLGKVFAMDPQQVQSIPDLLVELARERGLRLIKRIERQITGMANTMRTEFILLLQKA